jgi:microcystin-dependent protein
MSDQFVAEIRIFGCNFAPTGWAQCNGQVMPISQNTALFSLLGTFYGGDGRSTFALPNLEGSAPMMWGQGPGLTDRSLGESSGVPSVTLLQTEMPTHIHNLQAGTDTADLKAPTPLRVLARSTGGNLYQSSTAGIQAMAFQAVSIAGGGLPHNNMMPSLVLNFCIALQGIFPPRG